MKKNITCFVAMLMMVASFGITVQADTIQPSSNETPCVSPRAEETEWVFRRNPDTGVIEKRLWSNTYGKWKTDWEPIKTSDI